MTRHVTESGPKRPASAARSCSGMGRIVWYGSRPIRRRTSAGVGTTDAGYRPPARVSPLVQRTSRRRRGATASLGTIGLVSQVDGVERALVVVAHPDDCDFGCAATTAKWTSLGVEMSYCIITSGDAGGSDRSIARTRMAEIRQEEQRAAAAEVGVHDITFLGYPDGKVAATVELRRDISRVIRQKRPQRVLSQSPIRNFARIQASHPDHLAAGEATLDAVYPDARNPFAHMELLDQEGLEPWTVSEVWIMAGGSMAPDEVVDVTETADRKLAALRQHRSQYENWDQLEDRVRSWLKATAEAHGLGDGHMAEAFQVVHTG